VSDFRFSFGSEGTIAAKRVWLGAIALAILVAASSSTMAQQGAPRRAPAPLSPQGPAVSEQTQSMPTAAGSERKAALPVSSERAAYLTSIHGLQGVLAETLDGASVASQSVDEKFNPASSIKLATTLAALRAFGPDRRFATGLWTNGRVNELTGVLEGDLIVSGCDPSLHYEHAVMIAKDLNQLGIQTVAGNLVVVPSFTMNFDWSARISGQQFSDTLDASRRSLAATQAWIDERTVVGDNASLKTMPSVTVAGGVIVGSVPPEATLLLVHNSSKLVDVLKAMLCFSNNFMAERIGDMLGGTSAVRAVLTGPFKIDPEEVMLSSTSGLGENRVTPRAMMKILRALCAELNKNKLTLADVLPVAGVDPGTLKERYATGDVRGSVIAKTGTLIQTDGGASSLVGEARTRTGGVVLFVILNQQGNVGRFRENQDEIVTQIQNAFGGPAPFDYRPVTLSLRLADSDYATAKSGEYEPRNQPQR
jgi:D-alanyl-D-alanine carboxypeptidase/D-alanyl-D-alanine-endopeptidase (penicillin-binding protein 4)